MAEQKPNIKLSDIPKRDPFQAPDGYFDDLQAKIDRRIADAPKAKVIHVNWRNIGYAVAAAVTLLVAVLVAVDGPSKSTPSAAEMIAQLTAEDCLAYLTSTDIEIDEIIQGTDAEIWSDPVEAPMDSGSDLSDEDLDLLYERYGVTSDENLQSL
jgi:hypothetical protein